MTTTVKPLTAPVLPDQEELIQRLLSDSPLLADTQDHLVQVVNVLETYGIGENRRCDWFHCCGHDNPPLS